MAAVLRFDDSAVAFFMQQEIHFAQQVRNEFLVTPLSITHHSSSFFLSFNDLESMFCRVKIMMPNQAKNK